MLLADLGPDVLLTMAEHFPQADLARFAVISRRISEVLLPLLYRGPRIKTGPIPSESETMVALFQRLESSEDRTPQVPGSPVRRRTKKRASSCGSKSLFGIYAPRTICIHLLPCKEAPRKDSSDPIYALWMELDLQRSLIQSIARTIHRFDNLREFYWPFPLTHCLSAKHNDQNSITEMWLTVTALPNL